LLGCPFPGSSARESRLLLVFFVFILFIYLFIYLLSVPVSEKEVSLFPGLRSMRREENPGNLSSLPEVPGWSAFSTHLESF
jgi:hypothetical protein